MNTLSVVLSCIIPFVHFSAFIIYYRAVARGQSTLYTAMWVLTIVSSILNGVTYLAMTRSLVMSATPVTNAVAVCGVLIIGWRYRKFRPFQTLDWVVLGIGSVVIGLWITSGNASYANLLLQLALMLAIIPAYAGVWQGERENPWPWALWSVSHIINLSILFMLWNDSYNAFVSPILYIIANTGMVMLIMRRRS
ncbi:hypothetical protein A2810_02720 [candidate division Kazan bacterium RIFCSPHIGHO2_01_FULL_49_10]|uniref:Uncharacterized protein n=1 Tax=candidate division Kazan bacterium RIFCSPLOWO2_01_FULL_48_13 TaxID=1798539 RepID=A0A1F4PQ67_UNCK3|nr:MAG: hypothetical protein A2810_02720 [candidate division Kazan bacterium RIFCSPHIGHO2_01_FULL_49_10]OGB85736.1 MAG: hypothetical protein A2994_03205 [candidate division Kazan bacterium RIFCSPLOWO2_01_FULL_48_13]